ncbi:MAG: sodium-dependent transporter [Candidatus Asgardarchaeia archaeon]
MSEGSFEEELKREQWLSRIAFILAVWGSMTGLGNVWNWPFKVSLFGGTFLVAYLIMLFLVGIPLVITEFVLGSTTRRALPIAFKKIDEKLEFFGWFTFVNTFLLNGFYLVIVGWCLIYAFFSLFNVPLDGPLGPATFSQQPAFFVNMLSSPIVLVAAAVAWFTNYFIVREGTRGIEKVILVSFPLLWGILILMTVFGLFQPNSIDGLNFYLTPDLSSLLDPALWSSALSLSFFKLSAGFGILVAYASYLPRRGEIVNNSIISSLLDTSFAFTAGLGVFSTAAAFGQLTGGGGPGFAFVVWPSGAASLGGNILAFVFFVMMFIVGLTSSISLIESMTAALMDKFGLPRKKASLIVVLTGILSSVPYSLWIPAPGLAGDVDVTWGLYLLDIFDFYIENFGLVTIGLVEIIAMAWIWGSGKLIESANESSDFKLPSAFNFIFKFVAPAGTFLTMALVIFSMASGEVYLQGTILDVWAPFIWLAIVVVGAAVLTKVRGVE